MKEDNIRIKNHFQLIYQAFHRIVQKLPHSTSYLWQRIEENNLNLWDKLNHYPHQLNDLEKIKTTIENIVHYLSLLIGSQYLPDKNFNLLIEEYNKLLTKITTSNNEKHEKSIIKQNKKVNSNGCQKVTQRQERIIKFLQQREKTAVGEILMLLPQVSKRTIYRDLDNLAKKGVLKKETSKANSKKIIFYRYTN